MEKYFKTSNAFRYVASLLFSLMLIFNVMFSIEFNDSKIFPSISLTKIGNEALAQASVEPDCLGGSCSYTTFGLDGKPSSKCDVWGCRCE